MVVMTKLLRWLHAAGLKLTEPRASITDPAERRTIRLFSSLMLTLAAAIFCFQILPYLSSYLSELEWIAYQLTTLGVVVVALVASWLGRHGYHRPVTLIICALLILTILIFAYPRFGMWQLDYVVYLLLPLLFASIFLPLVYSAALLGLGLIGVWSYTLLAPEIDFLGLLLEPLGFVIVTYALFVIALVHFRHMGQEMIRQEMETAQLKLALDRERDLNYLKDHIMATISHEFKTPLSAIYTSAELLERYADRLTLERRLELLQRIQGQVRSLSDMVSEVTLLRRVQGGAFPIEYAPVNLRDFLNNVIREFQTFSAPDHPYTLHYQLDETELLLDVRLLRPIVTNLLSNAAKYSAPNSPIRLEVTRTDRWLALLVEDNGVGINAQDQAHIFEPFFRGDNAGVAAGTGLGLKIVKDCVTLYGGEINFTSQEGIGTRFAVRLPLKSA
jgi:signal transduction histidine kinase